MSLLNPQRDRLRSFAISLVSRFLALLVLSSFTVTALPLVSTSADSSMPCCADKTEGHCDSGLTTPKPRPKITEPMCGLEWSPETASQTTGETTVVTNPVAVESTSVEQECEMDCGACVTVSSRHKRQKSLTQSRTAHHPRATTTHLLYSTNSFYSSNGKWTQITPRGPPHA